MGKRKIFLCTLTVMFLISFSSFSQTASIKGRVIDAITNEPLPMVNILLDSTTTGTVADLQGDYIIENIDPGNYNLKCSAIGYTSQVGNIILNKDETLIINLGLFDESFEFAKQADEDILNGNIRILIGGFIIINYSLEELNVICKQYGFKYEFTGCLLNEVEEYNEKVYKYLDSINSLNWRYVFEMKKYELIHGRNFVEFFNKMEIKNHEK